MAEVHNKRCYLVEMWVRHRMELERSLLPADAEKRKIETGHELNLHRLKKLLLLQSCVFQNN